MSRRYWAEAFWVLPTWALTSFLARRQISSLRTEAMLGMGGSFAVVVENLPILPKCDGMAKWHGCLGSDALQFILQRFNNGFGGGDGVAEHGATPCLTAQSRFWTIWAIHWLNVMKEIKLAGVISSGTDGVTPASKDIMNLNGKIMVITGASEQASEPPLPEPQPERVQGSFSWLELNSKLESVAEDIRQRQQGRP